MKKVLIISYYWPPCGGIGVLRCLKIAKYLSDFGWEPIIFTADNADYPSIDKTNFKDIKEGTEVIKQKIWEPYRYYRMLAGLPQDANVNNVLSVTEKKRGLAHKLSVCIRSNFFIPDARAYWIRPSVKRILKYLEENHVDAIFSNGPPHSNTRIATIIKKKTGIPWLADFQDPWTQVDYFGQLSLTARSRKKHEMMEQEVFQYADHISVVSYGAGDDLVKIGAPQPSVQYWGFDPDDFKGIKPDQDGRFTICHGGILGYDRKPATLLKVLSQISEEDKTFAKDLRVKLFGMVDHSFKEFCEKLPINDNIEISGSVDRKEALDIMSRSSILLLLLNRQPNAYGRIPGKVFEYLALKKPVLSLGPPVSDVGKILNDSQAGEIYDYDDEEALRKYILKSYHAFKNNHLQVDSDIDEYNIRTITGKIAEILDGITESGNQEN